MHTAITVCAHTSRLEYANTLAHTLCGGVVVDDGSLGATKNCARAWQDSISRAQKTSWVGVVEDDAVPIPNIHENLALALADCPTDVMLAYLGTSRPAGKQNAIQASLELNPAWIISDNMLNHVAVFMRYQVAVSAQKFLADTDTVQGPDANLTRWAHQHKHPISVVVPSLFDHLDETPAVQDRAIPLRDGEVRKAYRTGPYTPGPIAVLDRATRNRYPRFG